MKINQKQANLLAKEIVKRLQAKKVQRLPEIAKARIENFVNNREELKKKEQAASAAREAYEDKFWAITGLKRGETNARPYHTSKQIIEAMEKKQIPSQQEIEDEIILKSMFANPEDMEKFVQSIVSKYEKKLQQKVTAN